MIGNNLENETDIRRFLLGEMPEDERSQFEARFIAAEDDLFDRIRAAEDELIESYVRGSLNAAEKEKFEKIFLTTAARRRRVAFTRTLLDELTVPKESPNPGEPELPLAAKNSLWNSVSQLFNSPKLAFGTVFVLGLLFLGAWLLFRGAYSPGEVPEIARETTPTPAVSTSPVTSPDDEKDFSAETNSDKAEPDGNENLNRNQIERKPTPPRSAPLVTVTLALSAGTLRSEGRTAELNLPKNARGARLQLNLDSRDYAAYRAEILDADGQVIWRSGPLRPKDLKVEAFVPAKNLAPGDHMLKLYGRTGSKPEQSVADYTFRVSP